MSIGKPAGGAHSKTIYVRRIPVLPDKSCSLINFIQLIFDCSGELWRMIVSIIIQSYITICYSTDIVLVRKFNWVINKCKFIILSAKPPDYIPCDAIDLGYLIHMTG